MASETETLERGTLGDEILEGAEAIARFVFGAGASRRRAYTAIKHGLPHFWIGHRLFARRSAVTSWIEGQERRR